MWDIYDENRRPLNKLHRRGDAVAPGEYHLVVEVWTINSKGEILLTLRHPDKEDFPNKWENTGGSAVAGESSRQAAVRELKEETGIEAAQDELVLLGVRKTQSAFVDTYLVRKDIAVSDLTMQDGETTAARWVTAQTLNSLIESLDLAWPVAERLRPVRALFDKHLGAQEV